MIALYPGSFDPPTLGHYNIIEKALTAFEQVIVGIGINPDKEPLFSAEERLKFFKAYIESLIEARWHNDFLRERLVPQIYTGLTVDFAKEVGARIMVRGLRDGADLKSEHYISRVNKRVARINTVFLFPDDEHILVSSSFVRQVAELGKNLEEQLAGLVDDNVVTALRRKFA